ncbi:hypothetical protein PV05_01165 [Exophiala xenobiotica]|uniref:CST complex subunit STN1 n=1 Tax=Exophiala xenobiotica TaxID=348802 RepID=A0A0D2EZ64_9EURO|nr:uncharacterized protein PV05_01165 [Exophiala xenobiotica]KIW60993.1 hypothetical protein PV05_01165 [Exophiala xenobiotica]
MQNPDHRPHENNIINAASTSLTFYPAYAFTASETWSKWVKLTAHDIHHVLKPHEKYAETTTTLAHPDTATHHNHRDAALLLFYLNHPIQFVQVVGVVVAFDEYFEKFWLFTIDDSSGATIDVTCPKPEKEKAAANSAQHGKSKSNGGEESTTEAAILQRNVSTLTIGTVVQAKGTLSTFRSSRQLSLLRLAIVPDTTHEMTLIASRITFLNSTLGKPWTLSSRQLKELQRETEGEKEQDHNRAVRRRKREAMKHQREERHTRVIRKAYEKEEQDRRRAADEAKVAGEVLRAQLKRGKRSAGGLKD